MGKWNKEKYEKLCKDIHSDLVSEGIDTDDTAAYDIAENLLYSEKGLKEFMRDVMRVQDIVGRLASDI